MNHPRPLPPPGTETGCPCWRSAALTVACAGAWLLLYLCARTGIVDDALLWAIILIAVPVVTFCLTIRRPPQG